MTFNPLTTRVQKLEVDPVLMADLLSHPLFLRTDDDVLYPMIASLKRMIQSKIRMDSLTWLLNHHHQRFDEALIKVLPGGKPTQELMDKFAKINESTGNARLCSKTLAPGEIYFRCLDCEVIDEISNISGQCQECFDQSKHDGHRIQKCKPQQDIPYMCDCGNVEMMSAEGFCPKHQPAGLTTEEMLAGFPQEVQHQFNVRFKKALYGIICMFEVQDKAIGADLKSEIGKLAQSYTSKLLDSYTACAEHFCKSFSLVLEQTLKSNFEEPNNLVWHDCNDLKDENHAKNSEPGKYKACSCTVIGCILRFSKFFEQSTQTRLEGIITESWKDKSSREFLKREGEKHIYFVNGDPSKEVGDLKRSNAKVWELFAFKGPFEDELQYLSNLVGSLKRSVDNFCPELEICNGIMVTAYLVRSFLAGCSESDVESLLKTGLLNDILKVLSDFQTKALFKGKITLSTQIQEPKFTEYCLSLQVERMFYLALDHAMRKASDFQPEAKDSIFKHIAKAWHDCFEKHRQTVERYRQSKNNRSYLCGLEKTLCLMIVNYLQGEITKDGLDKFFKTFLPDVDPSVLASHVIIGPLRGLGLTRLAYINSEFEANSSYYINELCLYDIDIVTIQIMALLINPQELFSIFIKGFFFYSQDLKEFCLSFGTGQPIESCASDKKMICHLKDLLDFWIYLMNDEISLMNLDLRDELGRNRPGFPHEKILRKVFVNLLIDGRLIAISAVKNLSDLFVCKNLGTPIDSIISKIITIDDQTNTIKLKKEYQAELDPYLMYKHYHLKERYQSMLAEEMNLQKRDTVSGVYYTDLPSYLNDLQRNVFQSQLPDFINHIRNNFNKDMYCVLKPALKLAQFNLQVLNDAIQHSSSNIENLKKKAETNFLNQNFAKSLNMILTLGEFKECELCIKKIQDLVMPMLQQPLEQLDQTLANENKEDASEEKKRQAKEKMEKLKEDFARKQALFAQKNENVLSPEGKGKVVENSPDRKDLVCQCCLDNIDETSSEEYGVPIYIEFTNNFYNTEEQIIFKEEDYTDLAKARWWPVISSCNHYYHHKCFDEHCHSSKGLRNRSSQYFINDVETQCALCKTLCNSFLDMNDRRASQNSKSLSESFFLRMENILDDRKAKLLMLKNLSDQEKLSNISTVEMSRRTYEYFIESFHIHEESSTLSESFELYLNFFKTLKDVTQDKISSQNTSRSILNTMRERHLEDPGARVCQEGLVMGEFFDILKEKCGLPAESQEDFMSEHLRIIKEYLAVNLVMLVRTESPSRGIELSTIHPLYKENKGWKSKLVSGLAFQMQKILLAFYLTKCLFYSTEYPERSEFCRTLLESVSDSEKLNLLLKHCGISISFDDLVEESRTLFYKDELAFALNLQGTALKISKQKLAPQYIQLPQTYMEFNQKYVRQRCSLCKTHNKNLYQYMCLICGEHLCLGNCDPVDQDTPRNLSKHAGKYHMGLALFFGIDRHLLIAVKWPNFLGLSFGFTYINDLGECIAIMFQDQGFDGPGISKHLDYKSFNLDKKFWVKTRDVIKDHNMGKIIFEKIPEFSWLLHGFEFLGI